MIRRDARIFKQKPLKRRSFWGWLFNKQIEENALIELTNAIVDSGRPSDVSKETIDNIHSRYRLNVYNEFSHEIATAYVAFVRHVFAALAKTELTQKDVDDIAALQEIFQIPADSVGRLNLKAGAAIYRDALKAALSDSVVTEKEKEDLLHLGRQLDLDEGTTRSLYNQALRALITEKVEDALEDGELSPDEEADIRDTCKRFDIDLSYTSNTEAAIRSAKKLWALRHGPLSPIGTTLQLKRGETCYACFNASWLEVRRTATTTWRSHRMPPIEATSIAFAYAPIVEDCLTEIDVGQLYLTNKRLIFVGVANTNTIPFSKVLKIEQFREGIKVHKETGRSPYLVTRKAIELGALAKRLLEEE